MFCGLEECAKRSPMGRRIGMKIRSDNTPARFAKCFCEPSRFKARGARRFFPPNHEVPPRKTGFCIRCINNSTNRRAPCPGMILGMAALVSKPSIRKAARLPRLSIAAPPRWESGRKGRARRGCRCRFWRGRCRSGHRSARRRNRRSRKCNRCGRARNGRA